MTEQSRAPRRRHIEPTVTVIYEAPPEDAHPTSNRSSSSDSAENGAWGHPGASSVRNCMADPRKLGPPSQDGATLAVTVKLRPDRGGLKLRLKTLFCKTAGRASLLDEPAAGTFVALASARRRFFQWSCKARNCAQLFSESLGPWSEERNRTCDRAIGGERQSLAILTDRAGRYAVETLQTEYLSLLGMSPTHAPAAADRSLVRFAYVSPAEYKRMKAMVVKDPSKTWNFSAQPSVTFEESYVDLSSDDSGPHDEDDRATGSTDRGGRQPATRGRRPGPNPRLGSSFSGETLVYTGRSRDAGRPGRV